MSEQERGKICFVISPIGEEESEERLQSNKVLEYIITPAAKECGYKTIRADQISKPAGMITSDIIQHLTEDELVIADLTGRNPNVFYELAIRHCMGKPVVQIIQRGKDIPFDVAQSRTIQYDFDVKLANECKEKIIEQIRYIEKNPSDITSPISAAIDLQALNKSDNPLAKSIAEIISVLQEIRTMIERLGNESRLTVRPIPSQKTDIRHISLEPTHSSSSNFRIELPEEIIHTLTNPRLRQAAEKLARDSAMNMNFLSEIARKFATTKSKEEKASTKAKKEE